MKLGIMVFLVSFSSLLCPARHASAGYSNELWQVRKSVHFKVYYKSDPEHYVDSVIERAEDYYDSITEKLGFRRFNYWTWDNACTINLYSSREDYLRSTNHPEWSGGSANIRKRSIDTFFHASDFLETTLPHEMTHLIFREFVGYDRWLPLWLDEGIACSQEKEGGQYVAIARVLVKTNMFIKLDKLTEITKSGLFMPEVFYAESAAVVEFLLQQYGGEKFIDFCRALRDNKLNKDWKSFFIEIYGFKNIPEMGERWKAYLLK
ncbi:MAG: hypothetical protein WBE75_02905 [Candidatus Omnitrophota bacterium]